jgi:lipopolysaccharide export system ATP-binding protein
MSGPAIPVLEARGVHVERGKKAILRDVEVSAEAGEVVGILGPSGAGKSTLFRALTGEAPPDAGTILLGGEDVTAWPLWRRARAGIGYIPQSASVFWELTVRANLKTYRSVAGVDGVDGSDDNDGASAGAGERRDAIEAAADRVGLAHRLDVRAGELSAGERRRLEFARAITRMPKVLICDEPFAGVDPNGAAQLGDLLVELATRGVTVLLADHHVAEALRVCTRAILLLDGAVAAAAEPHAFQEHPLVRGRYLGTWTRSIPPPPPTSVR